jgi:peptidoglycan/xylan/chitin deacetylase (PgdA/CDA1 family)
VIAFSLPQVIPILLYHSVSPTDRPGDSFSVTPERFAAHLEAIVAGGRTPLTVEEVAAGLRGDRSLPARAVAITFDDAYADTLEAVEALRACGLRATVYVTTGQIGTESMIDEDQLQRLSKHPDEVELGAHSISHPHLDELAVPEIEEEVRGSKYQLEELIGRPARAFAYPHGAYDRRVRGSVIAAGYHSAAAVKNALSHLNDDPWALARWTVRSHVSAEEISRVLEGHGASSAWPGERLRTRGYRVVRRLRRRASRGIRR